MSIDSARDALASVTAQPQCQEALALQLGLLESVAVRLGMYDAADWIRTRKPPVSLDGLVSSDA